jgi:hypothetical protein
LHLRPDNPTAAAGPLVEGLERLRRLRTQVDDIQALGRQLDYKIASFEDAILGCLGLDVECVAERAHVTPGERVRIHGRLLNPLDVRIDASRLSLCVPDGWEITPVSTHDPVQHMDYDVVVPVDAPVSAPFWLREAHDAYRYQVADETFACEALDAPPVVLQCDFVFAGQRLTVQRPATRRSGSRAAIESFRSPCSPRFPFDHRFAGSSCPSTPLAARSMSTLRCTAMSTNGLRRTVCRS